MSQPSVMFVANDRGGANFIAPVFRKLQAEGLPTAAIASGPARQLWPDASERKEFIHACRPAVIVTGTSKNADLEQRVWEEAGALNIPTISCIDAWMNMRMRFERPNGSLVEPNIIAVPFSVMADEIAREGWASVKVQVVGHPHLEATTLALSKRRQDRCTRKDTLPTFIFFSEPLAKEGIGFDQFVVADLMRNALAARPCNLVVKPHPTESESIWRAWAEGYKNGSVDVALTQDDSLDLLARADVVVGVGTMVLVEAAASGLPVLALQPHRRYDPNRLLATIEGIELVTDPAALTSTIDRLLAMSDRPAVDRFAGSIELLANLVRSYLPLHSAVS